jgi:ABC-type transport system involved in multi-copper enzyme maturation permease subunit
MVKEFRCRRFGRGHWMMRMMAVCVIGSIGLMWLATLSAATWGVPTLGGIMVLLQVALIVLVTPALASGMIAGERETRGWDILRMTPMSTGSILRGKFLAAGWTLFLLLLATLPGYAIVYLIDETQQYVVPKVLLSLLLTAVFALLLTAAVSSLFKRTAAATATAYALLVGGVAGSMVFWLGQEAPFSVGTVQSVLRFNPLAATLNLIGARGFERYDLVPFNWYFLGIACVVCLAVLAWRTWRLTRPQ